MSLFFVLDSYGQINCENQHKVLPTNNCDPCVIPQNQLPVAKLLLYATPFKENEKKIDELIKSSSSLSSIEYLVWGRDTLHFKLAEEIKKAMAKLNDLQPENHLDGGSTNDHFRKMHAFEQAIKEAQNVLNYCCTILKSNPNKGYNNATIGTCNKGGELNQLLNQADDIMHLILELYNNNQKGTNLDCCDLTNQPIDFHIQAAIKLIDLLNALQPYIDQLILVHELNLSAIEYFATQYNGNVPKDLERLRDISTAGLVADALVANGLLSKENLNKLTKTIAENEDKSLLINSLKADFGEDIAKIFKVLLVDFSIKDLRAQFKDVVIKYPEKINNLSKLADNIPNYERYSNVFGTILKARHSICIFYDPMTNPSSLGKKGLTEDKWWQQTQWLYYNSLTSLLNNAIAVKTYSHLLNSLNSLMNSQQTICLKGPKPKTKLEALEKINRQLGLTLNEGQFEEGTLTHLIPTIGRQRIAVNVKFGDCYCGSTKDARPAAIAPTPTKRINEIIRTVVPYSETLKLPKRYSDSLSAIYFGPNHFYTSYDKIYSPPIRFGIDAGYRFYNPKNGAVYFDIPTNTWEKTIGDSAATNIGIGVPTYTTQGNGSTGFSIDYLMKKNNSISINLQYNKTDWTIKNVIDYSTITFACPTCPPETKSINQKVKGTAAQQELNLGVGYFYYNTATVGPLIGFGVNASYKQTHAPVFTLREQESFFNSPQSSFYFGGFASLGLEWRMNANLSIACMHSLRIMATLKPEHQASIRLSTRL